VSAKRTNLSHSIQLFNTLIPRSRAVVVPVAYTVLVWSRLNAPVELLTVDPLYHSRHNGRDRQYECDRGIIICLNFTQSEKANKH